VPNAEEVKKMISARGSLTTDGLKKEVSDGQERPVPTAPDDPVQWIAGHGLISARRLSRCDGSCAARSILSAWPCS